MLRPLGFSVVSSSRRDPGSLREVLPEQLLAETFESGFEFEGSVRELKAAGIMSKLFTSR